MTHPRRIRQIAAAAGVAAAVLTQAPAGATTSLTLSGTDSSAVPKPLFGDCASGANECGTISLDGLGVADWDYVFGPTFEPDGRCFQDDGTFTVTLHSDGSTVTGSLTGQFCPKFSMSSNGQDNSWGNPFVEDDTIEFAGGSGQFAGLAGTAYFHTFSAGARTRMSLNGTLTG